MLVHPLCTERIAGKCDIGTPKTALLQSLPSDMLAWDGWDDFDEIWWPVQDEDQKMRVELLSEVVSACPEQKILIVGHGGFWQNVINRQMENNHGRNYLCAKMAPYHRERGVISIYLYLIIPLSSGAEEEIA